MDPPHKKDFPLCRAYWSWAIKRQGGSAADITGYFLDPVFEGAVLEPSFFIWVNATLG